MRWDEDRKRFVCEICGARFHFSINANYHEYLGHDRLIARIAERVEDEFISEMETDIRRSLPIELDELDPDVMCSPLMPDAKAPISVQLEYDSNAGSFSMRDVRGIGKTGLTASSHAGGLQPQGG